MQGAANARQFPQTGIPEFAFFGRSNAGKSSLINMLLNRKGLVKTGSRPGMTTEINFFIVNGPAAAKQASLKTFCVADLPGYGFAQRSFSERNRIDKMLYGYCTARTQLRALFFLMDIRRDPTETEQHTLDFFKQHGIKTVLTATKSDKIGKTEQQQRIAAFASFFNCAKDGILLTSSSKKIGREQLLNLISGYLDS